MYLGQTDAELEEILDAQGRVELSSEQYDAMLYERRKAREAGLAEGSKQEREAMKNALKNGATAAPVPPPLVTVKKDSTPMYVGWGVAALIALLYIRSQEKGGSKSKVSYSFMGGKKKKKRA